MRQLGQFDVDSDALLRRINSHAKYGSSDLEAWIFSQLDLQPGHRILDLGCGTGKQTIPLARMIGAAGRVVAADISEQSLARLFDQALSLDLGHRIECVQADFDEIGSQLETEEFDRVISCYALYYSQAPEILLDAVKRSLKSGGILFFCGPAPDNNEELKRFHYSLRAEDPPKGTESSNFMAETGPRLASQLFSAVAVARFENLLSFDSAEALYDYWSSYNLYEEDLEAAFKESARNYFRSHENFLTRKRVIGLQARK